MGRAFIIRKFGSVFVMMFIVCLFFSGCKKTPPAPPALTDDVKAAIQTEDQDVFQQESAQR